MNPRPPSPRRSDRRSPPAPAIADNGSRPLPGGSAHQAEAALHPQLHGGARPLLPAPLPLRRPPPLLHPPPFLRGRRDHRPPLGSSAPRATRRAPPPRLRRLRHVAATWQRAPYLRKLIAAGLDPIVPDLLFFGASSSPAPDRSEIFQARTVKSALDAIGVRRFAAVGVSYGGFVAYRMAAMYLEAVEQTVLVCAGVCLEESDLSQGLFPVSDVGEATELLVPRRPAQVRRLVRLTFVRPPPIMPSCFLKDYINVLGSDHIQEKTELLHTLIKDRKLSDLPKIRQNIDNLG